MRHRDFEIRITCDGKALDEYNVQVKGNTIECYVASDAGKIKSSNHSSQHLSAFITIDGRKFPRSATMKPQGKNKSFVWRDSVEGKQPLMFSEISVTDDENVAREPSWAIDLGLVRMTVLRSKVLYERPWSPPPVTPMQNFGPIHETAKKGGMHCVSLGPRTVDPNPTQKALKICCIDNHSAPYITFEFRYRPRAILQAQGIIERPKQPLVDNLDDPSAARDASSLMRVRNLGGDLSRSREDEPELGRPRKRPRRDDKLLSSIADSPTEEIVDAKPPVLKDEEDDSTDDLDALEAQLIQTIRQRIDRVKSKRSRASQRGIVKREPSPIRVGGSSGGVIDLTDD
ncbi:hypothetical protein EVJ58_g2557 [Rhodofomes roseus]|uniref:DUF7918 domain-containing protein n=1 Tax=Rhodofomes roseus TaxID=34475 RepID=A0A4Y9YPL4_9APHY|nr:hypothetical protein EVJ58_g2557 [Rhodofomes roseus]